MLKQILTYKKGSKQILIHNSILCMYMLLLFVGDPQLNTLGVTQDSLTHPSRESQ